MTSRRQTERRQVKHAGLRLEYSFLLRIPPRFAWPVIVALLFAVAAIEYVAPSGIWFGPAYLAVIALCAWSIGSLPALAIGLLVLSFKLVMGILPFHDHGSGWALANLAVRIAGIAIVVVFIGAARRSCEKEWSFARTDPLTGALNRQAFFELAESDQCAGGWSAMIYADLDGLKELNDEHGHGQGDLSLQSFAETVKSTIRKGDVFARVGGDEFVIFMKLKDEAAGEAVARRLDKAINGPASTDPTRLTCSLGVLLLPEGSKSIDVELRAADELMYEAKKGGSGVLVAALVERDGKMTLSPPISISDRAARNSVVRRTDRERGAEKDPPEEDFRKPESSAAAWT